MQRTVESEASIVLKWCQVNRQFKECLGWLYETKTGYPLDLCLPWPRIDPDDTKTVRALYIGISSIGNVISPNQRRAIQYLLSAGYDARMAWSAIDVIEIVKEHVDPREKRWIMDR